MGTMLIILNTIIFTFLSGLHVYWAFGGRWAFNGVFPENPAGEKPLNIKPSKLTTLIVSLGLLLFALITLGKTGVFDAWVKPQHFSTGIEVIATIFLLRTIGDFKYVGLTKKIKGTLFAQKDNRIYTPLTLGITLVSLAILL